jgi:hypothetical protein
MQKQGKEYAPATKEYANGKQYWERRRIQIVDRITINQFFYTIQISLNKPRRYQGIQYKREADNGLCE